MGAHMAASDNANALYLSSSCRQPFIAFVDEQSKDQFKKFILGETKKNGVLKISFLALQ